MPVRQRRESKKNNKSCSNEPSSEDDVRQRRESKKTNKSRTIEPSSEDDDEEEEVRISLLVVINAVIHLLTLPFVYMSDLQLISENKGEEAISEMACTKGSSTV